jgi:hypothetical protein
VNKQDLNTSIASLDSRLSKLNTDIINEVDSLVASNNGYQPAEAINVLLIHWLETTKPDMQNGSELDLARMALYTVNAINQLAHLNTMFAQTENLREEMRKEVSGE